MPVCPLAELYNVRYVLKHVKEEEVCDVVS